MPEPTRNAPIGRRRLPRRRSATVLTMCAAALIAVLTPVACAHSGKGSPDDNNPQIDARTRVKVVNQALQDMTIYVVTENGQQIRLGLANATSSSTFDIPSSLIYSGMTVLQFLAVPIAGSRTPFSQQLTVEPGDLVQLTITMY
jgi:hypothetical protein